jgi:transposase
MQRRKFSREFKLEAVRLVRERGVAVAQAARDLDVHENVLRKWVRELSADPVQAFPGNGQMKPEQLEIERLRREVAKLKAERDILKRMARPVRKWLRKTAWWSASTYPVSRLKPWPRWISAQSGPHKSPGAEHHI